MREISESHETKQKLLEENETLRRQLLQGEEDKYYLQVTKEDLIKENSENKMKTEKLKALTKELQVCRDNLSHAEESQRQLDDEMDKLKKELTSLHEEKNSNECRIQTIIKEKEAIMGELREREHELENMKFNYLQEIKLLHDKNTELEEAWIQSKETADQISAENVHLRTENLELELLISKLSLRATNEHDKSMQNISSSSLVCAEIEEDDHEFETLHEHTPSENSNFAENIDSLPVELANGSLLAEISAVIGADESFMQPYSIEIQKIQNPPNPIETEDVCTQCELEIICPVCDTADLHDEVNWDKSCTNFCNIHHCSLKDLDVEANRINIPEEEDPKSGDVTNSRASQCTITFGIIGVVLLIQNVILLLTGDTDCKINIFPSIDLSSFINSHGFMAHLSPPLI